jgi:hypothetical protein
MKPILATAAPEAEGISRDRQGGARESHLELLASLLARYGRPSVLLVYFPRSIDMPRSSTQPTRAESHLNSAQGLDPREGQRENLEFSLHKKTLL